MKVRRSPDSASILLSLVEARALLEELEYLRGGSRSAKVRQICRELRIALALTVVTPRRAADRIEEQAADLAAWIAAMPRCRWEDDHGKPQTCERPATRSDVGAQGDYFSCDECSSADGPHEYTDLPYAELIRKMSGTRTGSEPRR